MKIERIAIALIFTSIIFNLILKIPLTRKIYCVGVIEGDSYAVFKLSRTTNILGQQSDYINRPDDECNSSPGGLFIELDEVDQCLAENGKCSSPLNFEAITTTP